MKKLLSFLLASTIVFSIMSTISFATQTDEVRIIDSDIYTFNINDVPLELQERVIEMRMQPNNFKGVRHATLLAMGLTEEEISNLTIGQAADWLNGGTIIYPEYIEEYLYIDDLSQELKDTFEQHYAKYKEFDLTDEQIEGLYELGVNPFVYDDVALSRNSSQGPKEAMLAVLEDNAVRISSKSQDIAALAAGVHVVRGSTFENYIRSSLDAATVTSEKFLEPAFTTQFGLDPTPGTAAYISKDSHIAGCLTSVRSYVKILYNTTNTSGYRYNYYLWAEDNGAGRYHQGLDVNRGSNTSKNLYSPITGPVVFATTATTGLTVLRIFDIVTYDYFNFLHLEISPSIVTAYKNGNPTDIYEGDPIGTESDRGAPNQPHTHIEIKSLNVGPSAESTTVYSERFYDYF